MKTTYARTFWATTAVLAVVSLTAALTSTTTTALAASNSAMTAQGKTLTTQYSCTGCHGADLKGKLGPNLTSAGALKHYTKTTFERALNIGVDEKGQPLKPPMPAFHMAKAQADAVYAYLKTLK